MLVENLAQEAAFDPLHDHIKLATVVIRKDFHYGRVI